MNGWVDGYKWGWLYSLFFFLDLVVFEEEVGEILDGIGWPTLVSTFPWRAQKAPAVVWARRSGPGIA